ncbi:hypothetical protein DAEQUDRAFT_678586 [Daedalea quercina L-15889]|uniref:PQ-loop-domain-containing protein n=1 Tax=Daedalea quercina L-15889 TaxID=1314783 RepID=A0A165LH53_9APHY|nr:hypothetical protein DAEQUDRAFT_678586 [Daedalea quercina L-15889]
MPSNSVAENVLGTMGAVCWTIQLVPQIWKSWRAKSTKGLSPWLVALWGISVAFMGVYAIVQDLNIPLILQPQLFGGLCLASWAQCQYYGAGRPRALCVVLYVGALTALAGFQVGMVYAVRPSYERGDGRAVETFGIISSILLSLALFPQYYEISVPFMTIDMLGGVFSDLSLAFKPPPFNDIAAISYSLVVFFDGVVLLAAAILNPLAQRRRRRAAAATPADTSRADSARLRGYFEHEAEGDDVEEDARSTRESLRTESIRDTPVDAEKDVERIRPVERNHRPGI